jgi:hypothetical protein
VPAGRAGIIARPGAAAGASTRGSDTFTRTDSSSSLGTATVGGTWSALLGTWGVSSNAAYRSSAGTSGLAVLDVGVADFTATVNVTPAAGKQAGLVFRCVDSSNFLMVIVDLGVNKAVYYSNVADSYATPAGFGPTLTGSSPYAISVTCSGTTVTGSVNGTSVMSYTETNFSSATKVGLWVSDSGCTVDDFLVTG